MVRHRKSWMQFSFMDHICLYCRNIFSLSFCTFPNGQESCCLNARDEWTLFCSSYQSGHFACIRTIHLHWHIGGYNLILYINHICYLSVALSCHQSHRFVRPIITFINTMKEILIIKIIRLMKHYFYKYSQTNFIKSQLVEIYLFKYKRRNYFYTQYWINC